MNVRFRILAALSLYVSNINGGCHANDWPHSCQANFRIGPQRCEPCESGSYGCNCSEPCPYGTYGQGCYHVCDCSDEQFCDPVVGCTNNSRTVDNTTTYITTVTLSTSNSANQHNPPTESVVTPLQRFTTSLTVSIMTVIVFSPICACILIRVSKRFYKRKYHAKSTEGVLELGTNEEDIDVHSYLTISDRSVRMYAAVHYDEAEDSIESKTSPSSSLYSKKEEDASIKSDTSKISQGYLTPVVTTAEETKSDSQRSSDPEDFQEVTKCSENFESPASLSFKLGTLVKIDSVPL
ncbi:uncharacterized protein LOC128187996 [Crassostrea angulata]|uniref:uncharacterized protein LOC128187996 n=1 Tax=Magallana angulata TaxID=2784310 RepID=UPI0022B1BE81|nr:uncharacterized protein LOC128187996 [Crassostrea angulata]